LVTLFGSDSGLRAVAGEGVGNLGEGRHAANRFPAKIEGGSGYDGLKVWVTDKCC
jgi:hypothetical protein